MIELQHVRKRYSSGHDALRNINLQIEQGEMLFLTGKSGAGKSTLLKLIALLERPTAGKVIFEEQNLADIPLRKIPYFRRRIGFIFQNPTLLYDRSIFDNIALPLVISGFQTAEITKRVQAALDMVGLLKKSQQPPQNLSTGEQQRVGIARAIVTRPEVILADEPTGNLDPELSREIMNLFARLNQVGITLAIASHDLSLIESMPFRKVELQQGTLPENTQARESV